MEIPPNPANPSPSQRPIPTARTAPPPPQPLPDDAGIGLMIDSLLKRPAQLVLTVCEAKSSRFWLALLAVTFATFSLYGFVLGSFSGGEQLWASPVKVGIGGLFSLLICFPSFYIFAAISGIEISLRGLAGVFFAIFSLTGLLLLGFAPVAWVFSQSTESVNFIGFMHLAFWLIAVIIGMKLISTMHQVQGTPQRFHLAIWAFIFIQVSLQMTTTLRPIIGKSPDFLPSTKKFYLQYWFENVSGQTSGN